MSSPSALAVERPAQSFANRKVSLLAEPEPVNYIVDRLAVPGLLTLLVGQTTAGKTQLALQIAEAIGLPGGGTVCGLTCAPGHVVYLDAENGPRIIQGRRLAGALGLRSVGYFDMAGDHLDQDRDRELLVQTIREEHPSLVVIDSLRRLAGDGSEDNADDMAKLVGGLGVVARRTDAAIILLHHRSTKNGAATVRGSSAIEDQSDIIFTLDKAKGTQRRLTCSKTRVAAIGAPLTLDLQSDPLRFKLVNSRQDDIADRLDALGTTLGADGLGFAETGQAIGLDMALDADEKILRRVLKHKVDTGEWTKPSHGRYALNGHLQSVSVEMSERTRSKRTSLPNPMG